MDFKMQERFNVRLETRIKNGNLVRARESLGYKSASELARELGVSVTHYCRIESMQNYPSKELQERICQFFINRGILLFEEDVFPDYLRELSPTKKYIMEKSVQPTQLLSLNHISPRLLPYSNKTEIEIIRDEAKERLGKILSTLTEREEKVVRMIFGLDDVYPAPLEEVGAHFNVTCERVRQIEAKVLRKLRHPLRARELRPILRDLDY